jgi:NAD(P)-dependent dehydrogenase (short-subunit alcohol dehydrogenase family)
MPEARRVVVITGASAGVGRAIARRFADEGAAIALLGRQADRLDAAVREVRDAGSEALAVSVDVSDAEAVEVAATRVEEELGAIDVWVNNAMVTVFAPVGELTHEEFRRVTDVTYLGSVWGTMAALRRMRPRDRGTIVQVGSALAYRGIPLQSGYCGAKHALQGFLDSLRTELIHDGSGIRVAAVHLPALNTPQFGWGRTKMAREPPPVPPIFQPEMAAEAVVWAASNPRREVWVGWPTVQAIVGDKLAPGLLDRRLARAAYDAQQLDETVPGGPAGQPVLEPASGDFAAHGRFDGRAKASSLQLWLTMNRGRLGVGATALAAAVLATRRRG